MQLNTAFSEFLRAQLSQLGDISGLVSPNLISGKVLELPANTLPLIEDCMQTVREAAKELRPRHSGVCDSIDFHLTPEGQPKIIEVNTNAAFLALGYYLYQFQNVNMPFGDFSLHQWLDDIFSELKLFGKPQEKPTIAIVDNHPSSQNLYVEFLVYQAFLQQQGLNCLIVEPKDFKIANGKALVGDLVIDFVYNRLTDFYLREPEHQVLNEIYQKKLACFSPHPDEYAAVADKSNLIRWALSFPNNKSLLSCWPVNEENASMLWDNRKRLFFKPLTSYGSKQSYKGASISRAYFDKIVHSGFVAQEYCPASTHEFEENGQKVTYKADFRAYFYGDRLEHLVCRLYQGQVTNLQTYGGGFTPVRFV